MNVHVFLVLLAAGSAANAFWVDTRWPKLRPGLSYRLLLHLLVLEVLTHGVLSRVAHGAGHAGAVVAATLLLSYAFLVALWVMRAAVDHLGNGGGGLTDRV